MLNESEIAQVPSRLIPPPSGRTYVVLLDKYMELLEQHRAIIRMNQSSMDSAFSWQKYAINLEIDFKNALEAYNRCYQAHRKTDGEMKEITFDQLNSDVIPSGKVVRDVIE